MATLPTTLPILNSVVDQTRTKFMTTFERPIGPNVSEVDDGMAMIGEYTDPVVERAVPCQSSTVAAATAAAQKFLGTAIVGVVNVRQLPMVEQFVVPTVAPVGSVTYTLQRTPTANASFQLSFGSIVLTPPGVNQDYTIAGAVVTITNTGTNGNLMGQTLQAAYTYAPTYTEVLNRFHQASVNFDNVNQLLEQVAIGGGIGSEIFTNFWDSVQGQFTNGGNVYLGDGGKFVAASLNTSPKVGVVINAPTATDTTLGFRVTAEF